MIDIALAGPMGVGKTTLAAALVREHHYTRMSFANPLRYVTEALLGRPIDKKHDRGTLQRLGRAARNPEWSRLDTPWIQARVSRVEEFARHLFPDVDDARVAKLFDILYHEGYSYGWGHPDYWMQRWHHDYLRTPRPVIVDDVRFLAEGAYLGSLGFFVARLVVPPSERQQRIMARDGHWDPAWREDPTEVQADRIDAHVILDGTQDAAQLAEVLHQEAFTWASRTRLRLLR